MILGVMGEYLSVQMVVMQSVELIVEVDQLDAHLHLHLHSGHLTDAIIQSNVQ